MDLSEARRLMDELEAVRGPNAVRGGVEALIRFLIANTLVMRDCLVAGDDRHWGQLFQLDFLPRVARFVLEHEGHADMRCEAVLALSTCCANAGRAAIASRDEGLARITQLSGDPLRAVCVYATRAFREKKAPEHELNALQGLLAVQIQMVVMYASGDELTQAGGRGPYKILLGNLDRSGAVSAVLAMLQRGRNLGNNRMDAHLKDAEVQCLHCLLRTERKEILKEIKAEHMAVFVKLLRSARKRGAAQRSHNLEIVGNLLSCRAFGEGFVAAKGDAEILEIVRLLTPSMGEVPATESLMLCVQMLTDIAGESGSLTEGLCPAAPECVLQIFQRVNPSNTSRCSALVSTCLNFCNVLSYTPKACGSMLEAGVIRHFASVFLGEEMSVNGDVEAQNVALAYSILGIFVRSPSTSLDDMCAERSCAVAALVHGVRRVHSLVAGGSAQRFSPQLLLQLRRWIGLGAQAVGGFGDRGVLSASKVLFPDGRPGDLDEPLGDDVQERYGHYLAALELMRDEAFYDRVAELLSFCGIVKSSEWKEAGKEEERANKARDPASRGQGGTVVSMSVHRQCDNRPACTKWENTLVKFQACSGCRTTRYCSKECQRSHWRVHKKDCPGRKASAAAAEGKARDAFGSLNI